MVALYEGLLVKIPTRALKAYPLASILFYVIIFLTAVVRGSSTPFKHPHNSKFITSSSLVLRKSDTSIISPSSKTHYSYSAPQSAIAEPSRTGEKHSNQPTNDTSVNNSEFYPTPVFNNSESENISKESVTKFASRLNTTRSDTFKRVKSSYVNHNSTVNGGRKSFKNIYWSMPTAHAEDTDSCKCPQKTYTTCKM